MQTERRVTPEATAMFTANTALFTAKAPRGGYVTAPGSRHDSARTEGTYVPLPGRQAGNGEKVRGNYVTLHTASMDETEGSYTRRG